jgi:hypothetical protein
MAHQSFLFRLLREFPDPVAVKRLQILAVHTVEQIKIKIARAGARKRCGKLRLRLLLAPGRKGPDIELGSEIIASRG